MFEPKACIENALSNYYFNQYDENHYMNLLYVNNKIANFEFLLSQYKDDNDEMYARKQYNINIQANSSEVEAAIQDVQRAIDKQNACIDYIVNNITEFQPNVAQFLLKKYKKYLSGHDARITELKKQRNVESFESFRANRIGNIRTELAKLKEAQKDLELFEQELNSPEFQQTKTFLGWSE